ncbi:thiol reductant ABC exporter subunit CydC [Pistricoccus aurantiacus]|uniref:Thiol reductant ABC exporter subunit CydC n=1 Tax=Pistricoccus aurantiacus TaxID=1883414 RepID=A0A5B8SY72_9GAMM|nr:thiol reductant ABC exporter subunit CydC [Pistricoccus aurantiacus]QEA39773.1 thiol reductant ABC exporter subunit CydC [Pistricoccus aurantiacus]
MKAILVELRPWLRLLARHSRRLTLGTLLMALTAISAIGLLALSGWFITATALTGALLAAGVNASLNVYVPGGSIRFFAIARTVSRYLERVYNHASVLALLAELRAGMFAVLARLDARALSRHRASEWLNRLTADIDTLDSLYLRLLAPPLVALLTIGLVAGLAAIFLPIAGVAVLGLLLPLWAWLVAGQARLGMAASRRRVATLDRLRAGIVEELQGLAELKAYASLAEHRRRLEAIEHELYRDQRRLGRLGALGNVLVGLGVGITLLLVLWLGARAYQAESLSGPLLVMMPLAILALNETLAALPVAFTQFGATRAAARRLNALGDSRSALLDPETPESLLSGAPAIRFEAVSLRYPGTPIPALEKFDLTIASGQRLALTGASGAGKSSLANLLTRLIDPQAGRVLRDGIDLRHLPLEALRTSTAYLTQQSELFDASLADNLRLAAPQATDSTLRWALDQVELAEWVDGLAQGLDTRVGEGGRQLSGGQARRLALARVLLTNAPLVILDEFFTGLDRPLAGRIAKRLDVWLEGRTVIYLVHQWDDDMPLPGVGRLCRLREGRLVEDSRL